jgi:hypothetical protein
MVEYKSVLEKLEETAQEETTQENVSLENTEQSTSQENAETNQENSEQGEDSSEEQNEEAAAEPVAKKKGRPTKEESEAKKAAEAKPEKKFWETEVTAEEEDNVDYKSLLEQERAERQQLEARFEKLIPIAEALEDPDCDVDKLFDSFKPKDWKDISLEDLWKLDQKNKSDVTFTEDELDELWEAEKETITSTAQEKLLKDRLIKANRSKIDLGKEPEYITNLRKSQSDKQVAAQKQQEAYTTFVTQCDEVADSYLGKTIIGDVIVTKEDVEAMKASMRPGYYKNDPKVTMRDRLFMMKFGALLEAREKEVKMETKKDIHRPNPNTVGGDTRSVETTDETDKMAKDIFKNPELLNKNK